ncbi:S8/S53 family peptidase [Spongiactinospora sp. TRM90649]|uniref:S8 family peptidase n=1 Tax=Spongiactinospora sp. TRM90649 TaxID=3031114 RepID=UPI0023F80B4E|nr:S8/S53 family peptidase [Spongiactinospora sp. TRM90649]MDF5755592.1 S8/S53 family peptidase [Spongiactinospora sp. TRM90649]
MLSRVLVSAAVLVLPFGLTPPAAAEDVLSRLERDLRAAHKIAKGKGVTIAILSDGVDPKLSEVSGRLKIGPDLVKRKENGQRRGTLLASLIAGRGSAEGTAIKGIAPSARILSVRTVPTDFRAYRKLVRTDHMDKSIKGIIAAADRGADVILATDGRGHRGTRTTELADAVAYARAKGAVVVMDATRLYDDADTMMDAKLIAYPAGAPGVIGVGAVDRKGRWVAKDTGRNSTVQVSAPSTRVRVTGDGGQGWRMWGQNVAAAWVAGTVALIKERHPDMSPAVVTRALTATTRGAPKGGYDIDVGHGVINPAGALREAERLSGLKQTAVPGEHALRADARAGGAPGGPIRAVVRDRDLLTRNGGIALAGVLLLGAAIVLVLRGRRRKEPRMEIV